MLLYNSQRKEIKLKDQPVLPHNIIESNPRETIITVQGGWRADPMNTPILCQSSRKKKFIKRFIFLFYEYFFYNKNFWKLFELIFNYSLNGNRVDGEGLQTYNEGLQPTMKDYKPTMKDYKPMMKDYKPAPPTRLQWAPQSRLGRRRRHWDWRPSRWPTHTRRAVWWPAESHSETWTDRKQTDDNGETSAHG